MKTESLHRGWGRFAVVASVLACFLSASSSAFAADFLAGAVSSFPTGWSVSGEAQPGDVATQSGSGDTLTLAFDLADDQTLTYTAPEASDANGTADVVISNAVFTTAYEYPGVEAVGGIDSQAAICVYTNTTSGGPLQYYGWAGAYMVENDVTNLTWNALSGATPVEGATNTVTMSFDYTGAKPTVTFKVGNTTLTPSGIELSTSKTQVTGVSFSGTGSIGEMAGASAPPAPSTFTVNFYASEDAVSPHWTTNDVPAGATLAVYGGTAPTKASTDQYVYTFDGWTNATVTTATAFENLPAVVSDTNYWAHFAVATKIAPPTGQFLTYNGSQQAGVASGTGYTLTGETGTNAGSYTATATLVAGYIWSDETTAAQSIPWLIAKADINATVSMSDWVFGATASNPEVSGNTGSGEVTFEYFSGETSLGSTKPTDVGTYRVVATVAATTNYNGDTAEDTFAITAASPSLTVTMAGWTYGGEASNPVLTGNDGNGAVTYTYYAGETSLGSTKPADAGSYRVVAAVAAAENYAAGSAETTFTIAKADINATVSMSDWVFGATASNPEVSGNTGSGEVTFEYFSGETSLGSTKPTDVGTYRVVATVAATTNYNGDTAEDTFSITGMTITPVVSLDGWTVGDTPNSPSVDGNTGNGTVTYFYSADNGSTWTETQPTAAGTYLVKASVAASGNYAAGESDPVSFTIAEAVTPTLALAKPTLSSTVLANAQSGAVVRATIDPTATVNATNANADVVVDGTNATATFTSLPWNDPVDWMLQSAGAADLPGRFYAKGETPWFNVATDSLDTVTDLAEGMRGVDMSDDPSAAGQMVRIQTALEIAEGAMENLPTGNDVGEARTGFAVASLADDEGTAYFYAFNGSTWDKLSGAEPTPGTKDLLIVLDVEAATARYYVDGIALYKEIAGVRTHAIPMKAFENGETKQINGIGFANPDGVATNVVAEYDVPFEAAVGDVPYVAAADGLDAADKTGVQTLYLLTNDVAGTIELNVGDIVKVDTTKGSFAQESGVGLVSGIAAGYTLGVAADGNLTTYTVDLVEYPIEYVLGLAGATNAVANPTSYNVSSNFPIVLLPAGCPDYTFNGWTNAAGAVVTEIAAGTTGAVTNWASWRRNAVILTVPAVAHATMAAVAGGQTLPGTVDGNNTLFEVDPGTAVDVTFTAETGYHVASTGDPAITLAVSSGDMANDFTLDVSAAAMEIDTYTVTFTWHDDSTSASYEYGTPAADIAIPRDPPDYVENGKIYSFTGWSAELPATLTGNVTITAQYDSVVTAEAMVISIADAETGATTTNYVATLADAFGPNGAKDGDTVELLANVTLTERIDVNLGANTELTIDLGGYTVAREGTDGNGSAFDVKSGDVTIRNGEIDCTQDDTAIVADGVYAITSRSGSNVTLADLDITVNSECGACAYPFAGSTMTIESGTYANTTTTPYRYNTAITGMAVNQPNNATQNLIIKGGSFSQYDPQLGDDSGAMTDFTDDGFVAIDDGNGHWVVQPGWNVTFDANGGDPTPAAQRVAAGGTATAPTAPTKEHYSFRAWQTNGVDWVFTDAVPSDLTLVADWTIDQFDVIWVADGAMVASNRVDYGTATSSIQPADPTKETTESAIYAFTGWSPEVAATVTQNATYTAGFSAFTLDPVAQELYFNCTSQVAVVGYPEGATFYWTEEVIPGPSSTSGSGISFSGDVKPLSVSGGRKTDIAKFYSNTTNGTWHLTASVTNNNAQVAQLVATVTVKDVAAVVDGVEYPRAQFAQAIADAIANDKVLGLYLSAPSATLAASETLQVKVLATRNVVNLPTVTGPAGTDGAVYVVSKVKDSATGVTTFSLTAEDPSVMFVSVDGVTTNYLDAAFKATKAGTYTLLKDITRSQLSVGTTGVVLDLNGKTFTSTATGTTAAINVTSTTGTAGLTVIDSSESGTGAIVAPNYSAIQSGKNASVSIEGGAISGKTVPSTPSRAAPSRSRAAPSRWSAARPTPC